MSGLTGVVAACSSFAGTNPADVPGSDAGDDAVVDAGIDHVVTGTAMEAGVPNLLKDGTFERDCTALTGDHLSVTWEGDTTHNHSNGACRVCFIGDNAGTGELTLTGEFGAGPDRQLLAAAFLLADGTAPALQAYMRTNIVGSAQSGGGRTGPTTDLTTNDWTELGLFASFESKDAHAAIVRIDVFPKEVGVDAGTACFYVDDASLVFTTN